MENATVDDRSFWYNYLLNNTSSMNKVYALKDELDYIMEAPLGDENPSVKALLAKGIDDFTDAEKKRITDTLQKYNIEVFHTFDRLYAICKYAANIDHIRWNAYMRTEGFVFGPQPQNKEEKQKAKIAKTHHNLVPVSKLTLADCYKDI